MLGGERKVNKIIKRNYSIDVRTVSYLRRYCSGVPKFLVFGTPHEGLFLMFGMPNAKYLAFDTPDENALRSHQCNLDGVYLLFESERAVSV